MKKIYLLSAFLLLSLMGFSQSRQYPLAVGLGVNFPDFKGARYSFGDYFSDVYWEHKGVPIKINVGVNLISSLNLEASANFCKGENIIANQGDELISFWDIDLNLQYRFANGYILKDKSWWDPYILVGPQVSNFNDKTYFSFDYGVGMNFWIVKHLAVYGQAAYDVTIDGPGYYHFGFGLKYRFNPAPDKDKDGIKDKKDKCPETPGLLIYEGCPDTDGDSIPDNLDKCPTVKGLKQFEGCPDTDGDGIQDKDDACPTQAGPKELQGCPDRDGDGIADKDDRCPDVKGLKEFKGCPDTDGDGIADPDDQCPTEKGPASNNGCPPPPPPPPVINFPDLIVYFGFDKRAVTKEYKAKIDEAIKIMNENPNARFTVYGYADSVGEEGYNMGLSDSRASNVLKYLTEKGVPATRFDVKGFGESNPAAPNNTADGRAKNRRVEVKLIK